MIKAVVFDLDDTLISEQDYIVSGFKHISEYLSQIYGVDTSFVYKKLISQFRISPINVFDKVLVNLKIEYNPSLINTLVQEYRNHFPNISFYDDVIPCLEYLEKSNINIGIITDGYAASQRKKLRAIKAENYFDNIIVTDELGREYWKPNPKAFELMKEKMNIDYREMVYIGDNPQKDFYISHIFPINTVRILRNGVYSGEDYYKEIKEDIRINNLSLKEIYKITSHL